MRRGALHGLELRLRRGALWWMGLAGIALGCLALMRWRDASPRVQGKSLRAWVALAARQTDDREIVQTLSGLGPVAHPWLIPYLLRPTNVPSPVRSLFLRVPLPEALIDWLPGDPSTAEDRCRVALHVVEAIGSTSESPALVSALIPLLGHESLGPEVAKVLRKRRSVSVRDLEEIARALVDNPRSSWTRHHVQIVWAHGAGNPGAFERFSQSGDPGIALLGRVGMDWFAGRVDEALETVDTPWRDAGDEETRAAGLWERRMSLTVLGEMGGEARPLARRWIRRLQQPGDVEVREAAATGLGMLGSVIPPAEVGPPLLRCLDGEENAQVRLAAIEALGRVGLHEKGIDVALEGLLQGSDEEAIAAARRSLQNRAWAR